MSAIRKSSLPLSKINSGHPQKVASLILDVQKGRSKHREFNQSLQHILSESSSYYLVCSTVLFNITEIKSVFISFATVYFRLNLSVLFTSDDSFLHEVNTYR